MAGNFLSWGGLSQQLSFIKAWHLFSGLLWKRAAGRLRCTSPAWSMWCVALLKVTARVRRCPYVLLKGWFSPLQAMDLGSAKMGAHSAQVTAGGRGSDTQTSWIIWWSWCQISLWAAPRALCTGGYPSVIYRKVLLAPGGNKGSSSVCHIQLGWIVISASLEY